MHRAARRLILACLAAASLAACTELAEPDVGEGAAPQTGWSTIYGPDGATARVQYAVIDGQAFVEDDYSLGDVETVRARERVWSAGGTTAAEMGKRWADGVVYYSYAGNLNSSEQADIEAGMQEWGRLDASDRFGTSRITFQPAVTGQPSIFFNQDVTSGSSWTQNTTTGYTIHLTSSFSPRTAAHEIGHALGLFHEARRADRNSFVIYHNECYVPPANGLQPFAIISWTNGIKLSNYDISSVMEYGSFGFNLNSNCPTLLAKAGAPAACSATNFNVTGMPAACAPYVIGTSPGVNAEDLNGALQLYDTKLGAVEDGDMFGETTVAADFDGDGYEDLAVGAPNEGPDSSIRSGAVFLYKGTFNGLVAWKWLGEADFGVTPVDGDAFGDSLAAGWPTGATAATLFVGAPGRNGDAGAVYRYDGGLGGPAPAVSGVLTEATGGGGTAEPNDRFGAALKTGKFRGSGNGLYLAVGATGESNPSTGVASGYVFVYQVTSSAFAYSQKFNSSGKLTPSQYDNFGFAMASADLDGDGADELAVSTPYAAAATGGAVVVYAGSSSGLSSTQLLKLNTGVASDDFGWALVFAKYDGTRKLIVGAPGRDNNSGRVFAYAVSTWNLVQTISQADLGGSIEANDYFGLSLAAGDVDGSGAAEVLVGAPWEDDGFTDNGWFVVLKVQADGKLDKLFAGERSSNTDYLGYRMAVGDFNQDGIDDFVVTALGWSSWGGNMDIYQGRSLTTPVLVESRSTATEHLR